MAVARWPSSGRASGVTATPGANPGCMSGVKHHVTHNNDGLKLGFCGWLPAPQGLLGLFIFVSWWAACAARQPLHAQGLGGRGQTRREPGRRGTLVRPYGAWRPPKGTPHPVRGARVGGGQRAAVVRLALFPPPPCSSFSFPFPRGLPPLSPDVSGYDGCGGPPRAWREAREGTERSVGIRAASHKDLGW